MLLDPFPLNSSAFILMYFRDKNLFYQSHEFMDVIDQDEGKVDIK